MLRSVLQLVPATPNQAENLTILQSLPSEKLPALDPFLLLHHIGPEEFPPGNQGLPFGPHPHRGFETVTLVLAGEVMHQDSRGNKGTVGAGGVQWMTAARGIIHSENTTREFRREGGTLELLQLWVNLPAARKMEQPSYQNLPAEALPTMELDGGWCLLTAIAGHWEGVRGPVRSLLPGLRLALVRLAALGTYAVEVSSEHTILLYVVRGQVSVNGTVVPAQTQVQLSSVGTGLHLRAETESLVLLASAPPLNEPVVQQGPYVMNTTSQIMEAMRDYQMGRMGVYIEE
ncbi:pirin family protein [Hymenobacter wooponensis]|uniref:Pirin family protein n=1 Tax=Hymenobacter wooponensis TaxID=1525360 RepID=A0A4Z0MCF2_9BACT|nr:pirin family protein [Hymenobacter wooponensis]TGD77179.1 pirin family protein [Hymenobacter wooponensis]